QPWLADQDRVLRCHRPCDDSSQEHPVSWLRSQLLKRSDGRMTNKAYFALIATAHLRLNSCLPPILAGWHASAASSELRYYASCGIRRTSAVKSSSSLSRKPWQLSVVCHGDYCRSWRHQGRTAGFHRPCRRWRWLFLTSLPGGACGCGRAA